MWLTPYFIIIFMIKEIRNFNLRQIADSGQCFRMKMTDEEHAVVVAMGRVMEVRHVKDDSFEFDCSAADFNDVWSPYFDLDTDYGVFIKSIPGDDAFLLKAATESSGIRILRQDPFEMLITFIISQRKSIPAIRTSVEKLCRMCGNEIRDGFYSFPDAKALAQLSDVDLASCSLGYRTEYVRNAAQSVFRGDTDPDILASLSDEELFEALTSLKGVGKKVANCVMLFGFHRIGAFPVDVWMQRVIDEQYGGHFPLERYDGFAGVMQQYLFYYRRNK